MDAPHLDADGGVILDGRVGFTLDPAEALDAVLPANCDPATQDNAPNVRHYNNAYPGPNDGLNPQPLSGKVPRLLPCTPPPRSRPKDPCK